MRPDGRLKTTDVFIKTGDKLLWGERVIAESFRLVAPPLSIFPIPPAPLGSLLGGLSEPSSERIALDNFSFVKRVPFYPVNLTSLYLWSALHEPFLRLPFFLGRIGYGLGGLVSGSSSIGTTLLNSTEPFFLWVSLFSRPHCCLASTLIDALSAMICDFTFFLESEHFYSSAH